MQENERRFSIEELAELVNLPVRTIRYYITEGLLPGPGARGKAATYGEEHLLRLRLIRRLSGQHMPLSEMELFLSHLSLAELRSLLVEEDLRASELGRSEGDAAEYIAGLLTGAQAARRADGRVTRPNGPGRVAPFSPLPTPPGKTWQRWELAPGVELHIRSDAESQERSLIERLFKAVGMVFHSPNR